MINIYLKRFIASTSIACLLLSSVAGCGKKDPGDSKIQQTADNTQNAGESSFPIVKEPITLKILKPLTMYDTEYSKMPVLQDYEKKTNIHIEWNSPAAADFTSKYNLIMNSGDLPDAIIQMPADDIERYGQMGALMTINDLIEKNMPNLKNVFTQYPDAKKTVMGTGGKIYSMPYVFRQTWGNNVMMVREDWLKKLNLKMPETIDDWYNVLKAFKDKDPNGNGKADELPFSGNSINMLRAFSMAWGIHDVGSSNIFYGAEKLYPKDGKVHYTPLEDRYKEAVTWMNKLYKDGLIDPEIVTNDTKAFQAKMTQNLAGATRTDFGSLISMNETAQKNGDANFHLVVAPVIKGPYGDQFHTLKDPVAYPQGFAITSKNKYPTETAKWADYWYGEEGQLAIMGIEGKSYTIVNGQPQFTDWVLKNPDGLTFNEAWGSLTPGRSYWPTVWLPAAAIMQRDSEEVKYAKNNYLKQDNLVLALPPRLSFSQQENDRKKQLMADIQTYVDESVTNFIIGKAPLSDWDKFTAKIKSMGIDEVLGIYNKAYSEWKAK